MTIGRRRLASVYTDAGDTLTFPVRRTPLGETAGVAPAGPGDWLDEAKCATDDTSLAWLFDDENEEYDTDEWDREWRHEWARVQCGTCPVVAQCLAVARPGDGIRGGVLFPHNRKEDAA